MKAVLTRGLMAALTTVLGWYLFTLMFGTIGCLWQWSWDPILTNMIPWQRPVGVAAEMVRAAVCLFLVMGVGACLCLPSEEIWEDM